jgi:hypothetical protein
MADFLKLGSEIWRLYETDGVPASGAHDIPKEDMQAWMATAEDALDELDTRTSATEGDIGTLQDDLATVQTDITTLQGRATALEAVARWTLVQKTVTQTKISTSTLAVDSVLKFTMAASTKYVFRAKVFIETNTTPDFKWRHAGPASPTRVTIKRSAIVPAATALSNIAIDSAYSAADITMLAASGTLGWLEFEGVIENGLNAGDFEFQWAQNTSDASTTSVLAGSYLEYRAVA